MGDRKMDERELVITIMRHQKGFTTAIDNTVLHLRGLASTLDKFIEHIKEREKVNGDPSVR